MSEPEWVHDAIWWHVYPLGFLGAEPEALPDGEVRHRLPRLHAWLDYAVELGVSGLALGPVFASSTHGYDTVDHLRVDPRLGDADDLAALIGAAHDRGLRVLLDGVFNHVGRDHPAFRAVLEQGPQAPTASWFRLRWPTPWQPGVEPEYDCFEGHDKLVELALEQPAVAEHVGQVMRHWLDAGADGWRLDAAYAVPPATWAPLLHQVRRAHPQAYLVGEVIHGDYVGIVRDSGMHAVTQYELWKAVWSSLDDTNLFELSAALQRHDGFCEHFAPLTFVGNHDVTRIASRLGDVRLLPHALVVLLTVGGTPSVYSGDEQAFRGVKEERAGGDDAVRPAFPDDPAELAPQGWDTYRRHQELIALRRRHRWLHRARTTVGHVANEAMTYRVVAAGDAAGQSLLVALNLADTAVELPAPHATGVEAGVAELTGGGADAALRLPPRGWAVLTG